MNNSSTGLRDLSILSNFPSLIHCFVEFVPIFDVELITSAQALDVFKQLISVLN